MQHFSFDDKHEFLKKLEELVKSGTPKKKIDVRTPYPVHETEDLLDTSQSPVRFFQGVGAVTGLIAGYWFTSYTVVSWPMITGGKPFISVPAFTIIAYELTILFGCLGGFAGFAFLSRLPVIRSIGAREEEFTDKFEIYVKESG